MTTETLHTIIYPINERRLPEPEEKIIREKIFRVLLDDPEIEQIANLVPNAGLDLSIWKLLFYDETDETTFFLPKEVTDKLQKFDRLVKTHQEEIQKILS